MPQFLLRVEGVNLAAVIDDTDDLSTRRGGGLMALNAVVQLLGTLASKELRTRLTPVATGASIGLFQFEAADEADANGVREAVREHFRTGKLKDDSGNDALSLEHGTFVVDVVPTGGNADADRDVQLLMTKNRWRQLREPTVSLAGVWEAATAECRQNCVRPAGRGKRLRKDREHDVCGSVFDRHEYGRDMRQRFYRDITGEALDFTDTFAEVSDRRPLDSEDHLQPTHDKLAVFYADGNRFGGIGQGLLVAGGVDTFREWSTQVRKHHDDLLGELLGRAKADSEWRNGGAVRLETLLWGGDEIIWVVPAWKGWEVAEWFFRESTTLRPDLTYAAGVVFCGTKTPIHNVVKLARRLGDVAKDAAKKEDAVTPPHRLAYEVLESFDDITGDLDAHRTKWLPPTYSADALVLDPVRPPEFWQSLRTIAGSHDFPTRQLYMLLQAWRTPPCVLLEAEARRMRQFDNALRRLRGCGDAGKAFEAAEKALGDTAWLHLLNMLPYIPEAVA